MTSKLHEFSIIASGLDPQAADLELRFLQSGCDDATLSFQKGHIILDFAREASSLAEAIASAAEGVVAAGASIIRIEPEPLVSLSDIAARAQMTKAAISLYIKEERGAGDFPAPVRRITSTSPLWDWLAVARWLFKAKRIDQSLVQEAETVSIANEAIEQKRPVREAFAALRSLR